MTPQLIGTLVDAAIPIAAGLYGTLLGFRVVGKKPGESEKYDQWHARFGKAFRIGGPILILLTVFRLVAALLGVGTGARAAAAPSDIAQKLANIQPDDARALGDGLFIKRHRVHAMDPSGGGWQRAAATAPEDRAAARSFTEA